MSKYVYGHCIYFHVLYWKVCELLWKGWLHINASYYKVTYVCFKVQHLNNFQTIFSWCRHGKTHVEWLWNYGKVYYPSGSLVSSSGPWAQGPLQPDTHTKQKKKPKVMYRNTDAHEHIPEDAVIMWLQNTLWRDNASHIQ